MENDKHARKSMQGNLCTATHLLSHDLFRDVQPRPVKIFRVMFSSLGSELNKALSESESNSGR